MEIKKIRREDNRIIGGVCSGISKKYNVYLWITRLTFVIASWLLLVPFLIYLGLWIAIPSRNQFKITDRVRLQPIGMFVGAFIGVLIFIFIFSTDSLEMDAEGNFVLASWRDVSHFSLSRKGALLALNRELKSQHNDGSFAWSYAGPTRM